MSRHILCSLQKKKNIFVNTTKKATENKSVNLERRNVTDSFRIVGPRSALFNYVQNARNIQIPAFGVYSFVDRTKEIKFLLLKKFIEFFSRCQQKIHSFNQKTNKKQKNKTKQKQKQK